MLWSRWVLLRLDIVAASSPVKLIFDLRTPIFYKGVLADRLRDTALASLPVDDQRAVGIAVGQRATSGTIVVWRDGVRTPADSGDLVPWPVAYREGVAEGLLVNADGHATPSEGAPKPFSDCYQRCPTAAPACFSS